MKIQHFFIFLFFLLSNFIEAQVTNDGIPKSWKLNLDSKKILSMPDIDLKSLQTEDEINDQLKDQPYRFGYEHQVSLGFKDGNWNELKNGDKIWLLNVKSKGAKTLNFLFDEYNIPDGAKLYFYNDDKTDLLGAYTSSQNREDMQFGTWLINGDNVWIEYSEPSTAKFRGQLHISKVVHGYRSVNDIPELSKALNDSGPCNQDVDCPLGEDFDDLKNELKKSVGMVLVNNSGFCTGALINNTSNDQTPYFLTANHCLGGSVANWAFRFNWVSPNPSCSTTANSSNGIFNQTISGATLLANNAKSDFALLKIDAPLPNNWDLVWAGWDRSQTVPKFTVGIHHPRGDIMKLARDNDAPSINSRPFNGINNMDNWFLDQWEVGVTEPGSSGSPLFSDTGKIIGQLAGGSAACSGISNNGGFDYYGRFDVSWDFGNSSATRLRDWLDPDNTGELEIDQFPPVQLFNNDIALVVENIDGPICGDEANATFRIFNRGMENVTNATLTYQLEGENEETIQWNGNLGTGETDDIGSAILDLNSGNVLEAILEIDGVEDEFLENNSVSLEIDNFQDKRFTTEFVTFTLLTDDFASETSWEFLDENGNVIQESEGVLLDNTTYVERFMVDTNSCYELSIFDSAGDGICCGFGQGSYTLATDSGETIAQGGEFAAIESVNFRVDEIPFLEDFEFKIYPNPVDSILFIESNVDDDFEALLYEIRGKLIFKIYASGTLEINLNSFSTGIYFVKLSSGSQTITKKIIKK